MAPRGPNFVDPRAAPRASPAERAIMAGTPLQMGTGQGAGMHASHRHTDAYMAQMYAALEVRVQNTASRLLPVQLSLVHMILL